MTGSVGVVPAAALSVEVRDDLLDAIDAWVDEHGQQLHPGGLHHGRGERLQTFADRLRLTCDDDAA